MIYLWRLILAGRWYNQCKKGDLKNAPRLKKLLEKSPALYDQLLIEHEEIDGFAILQAGLMRAKYLQEACEAVKHCRRNDVYFYQPVITGALSLGIQKEEIPVTPEELLQFIKLRATIDGMIAFGQAMDQTRVS